MSAEVYQGYLRFVKTKWMKSGDPVPGVSAQSRAARILNLTGAPNVLKLPAP